MGLIPGGRSFSIDVPNGASSVNWSPIRVPAGTGVMLVAGDNRGRGTGGSSWVMMVQDGSGDCLNDGQEVYSSTNSPYAGGQYATGSGGGTVTGPWNNGGSTGYVLRLSVTFFCIITYSGLPNTTVAPAVPTAQKPA